MAGFGFTVLRRELSLARRRPVDALLPLGFFVVAVSLFPLGVGPDPQTLRQIAPGVVWACVVLAAMLSARPLYAGDHEDGSLDQLLLCGQPAVVLAAAKACAHWLQSGVPLVLAAPVAGLLFGLPLDATLALAASLAIGTPVLSLLGGFGAALTLGLRSAGMLIVLIVLPLAMPALVFGAGAAAAVDGGQSAAAHLALLGAMLIASVLFALPATAAALRLAAE
ncbi:heme exporter protein CcmB [Caldimonas sp. KR1-144]|uniref:heme exporter protein CcmB n=1 Tax=Caldimonas sp. KR1-144 TaxID=3400911 RepID=UPI003BFBBF47